MSWTFWPQERWRPSRRPSLGRAEADPLAPIEAGLAELDREALRRTRRVVETACSPQLSVDGASLLAFCSNDYLGLAAHPAVVAALAEGARRYGAGSGASHLISGHSIAHAALEEK